MVRILMWHRSRSVRPPAAQLSGSGLIVGAGRYRVCRNGIGIKPRKNFLVSENAKAGEVGTKY